MKKDFFRGCQNIEIIWHGTWSAPELRYKNYCVDYSVVEDTLWEQFRDEFCAHEKGDSEEIFNKYVQAHEQDAIDIICEYGQEEF